MTKLLKLILILICCGLLAVGGLVTWLFVSHRYNPNADTPDIAIVYTVSFDTRGGTEAHQQRVERGGSVIRPPQSPLKDGFVFDDWYLDLAYTTLFDFNTSVLRNITIYARWVNNA